MKFSLSLATAAVALLAMSAPAKAEILTDKIDTSTAHRFVKSLNSAVNHPDLAIGRNFFERTVTDNSYFATNITNILPGHPSYSSVLYNGRVVTKAYPYGVYPYYNTAGVAIKTYPYGYYPYYNASVGAYPHYPYYTTTNYRSFSKGEMINNFETKKKMVVGYRNDFKIDHINISPDESTAVITVDSREYGANYVPGTAYLTESALHANSKCSLYLGVIHRKVQITRMDCNTNAYVPVY